VIPDCKFCLRHCFSLYESLIAVLIQKATNAATIVKSIAISHQPPIAEASNISGKLNMKTAKQRRSINSCLVILLHPWLFTLIYM